MTENIIPIYMVTNTDMVAYTATTMCSVLYTTKSNIDFYVIDCGLSDWDKQNLINLKNKFSNLNSIQFFPVDLKQFGGLQTWYFGTLDAWSALLMPDLLPDNIHKILHIESDVIFLDDVKKLYDEDLEEYVIGATQDIQRTAFDMYKEEYFNLGYMLVNVDKWKEQKIKDKALEIGKKYGKKLFCLHQDALNIVFDGNFKLLPNRYNLAFRSIISKNITEEYLKEEWKHPVAVHFSPNKPWRTQRGLFLNGLQNKKQPYFNEWWFFASMTPYIEGLKMVFIAERVQDIFSGNYGDNLDTLNSNTKDKIFWCKLFNFIPFIKIKRKEHSKKIYLFGIPLFSIKYFRNKSVAYFKLFSIIPILKLRVK